MKSNEGQSMPSTVRAVTEQFVSQLVSTIEDAMKASIREQVLTFAGLSGSGTVMAAQAVVANGAKPAKASKKPAKRAKAAPAAKAANGSGLDKKQMDLWKFIERNPGARAEKIPAALNVSLLKGMFESGYLRRTGVARGTQYFVTKKAFKS